MTAPVFVDSNVLVYRHDTADPEKQAGAETWLAHLWRTRKGRLSTQVLQEFYVNVTQKLKPGLDRQAAREEIRDLTTWGPVSVDAEVIESAWAVQDRFGLSFWDSLIVAAAQASGCRYLLTEDLQHGQDLDGIRVTNPFLEDPGTLAS